VELAVFARLVEPIDQLCHQLRCVEGRGGLEDDADLSSLLIDGGDTVRQFFVFAAMPSVLPAVTKKIPVELLDVILAEWQILPRAEDGLHDFGVTCDLLLVAAGERSDSEIGQQPLDLPVRQLAAFDPGRGTNALNRGDMAKRTETLGSKRSQSPPGTLELVDACDQTKNFGCDLESAEQEHLPYVHP
jgi:hypothetical protein